MRKFYLELDGTRVGLNGENNVLFETPTGLGVTFTATNAHIGNGFYFQSDIYEAQGQVVGNVEILRGGYSAYQTFANALISASNVKLIYAPLTDEYTADAYVVSFTKTELTAGQILTCPLTLGLKSLWYKDETLTGTGSVSVTAGGQIAPAIVLTTTGTALTNPKVIITETVSGDVVARAEITGSIASTDSFQYSNLYDDSHIYQMSSSGAVTDIISKVNTAYTVFGRTMKNFIVALNPSAAISVKVRKYWRTV